MNATAVVESKTSNGNLPAPRIENAFGPLAAVSAPSGASANALMAREAQDIMVQMMAARNNPREVVKSVDRILNAFTRPALCEDALYEYARGGTRISGLSIRAAEVLAQNYGNMRCGVAELSRVNGQSEVFVFAQDLETGFSDEKRFYVKHWRDTKQGGYAVTDERDIYEIVANQGARRKRACILAVIPKDVQDAAEQQISLTMNTKAQVTPEALKNLLDNFTKYGVSKEMIEKRIQRHIDAMQPAQLVQLRRIGASLRDGISDPQAWFDDYVAPGAGSSDAAASGTDPNASQTQALKDSLRAKDKGAKTGSGTAAAGASGVALTEAEAIRKINAATTLDALAIVWDDAKAAFKDSPKGMPVDVDSAHHFRLEVLR